MEEPIWVNYHKHTSLSNVYTKDSPLVHKDYWDELKKRYGEKECIYTTVEHGWAGNYFKTYDDLEKYNQKNNTNIRFVFGTEAYWVKDRHEEDKSNCHIILLARNDKGRKQINKIISIANKDGYYYRPRIDKELLDMLDGNDVMITTACIAFWNKYEDIDDFVQYLADRFLYFFLEVQPHNTDSQKKLNKHIITMHNELNIPIIAGIDSHVITENQMADRDDLLESAHISYEDEDGWYMDYPTYNVLFKRFQKQGILKNEEIKEAIKNTNIIFKFEDIILDRSLKVPVIKSLKSKTQEERNKIFENILKKEWKEQKWDINQEKYDEYIKEIKHDIKEIESCNMADYFILSYYIMKYGQEKYNGALTPTGRGSAVSMYLNKLLRLTKVDKVNSPVLMYSERFLTKERVLESHTPPDIDNNVSKREPFIQAQKELIGELGTYDLIALGTLKLKAAWKMYARANGISPETANEVSKQLNSYELAKKHAEENEEINIEDYVDSEYKDLVNGCRKYLGIYDTIKGHPCFTEDALVKTSFGYKKIKDINIGDFVFSHDNKYHVVKNKMITKDNNDIYKIKIFGSNDIKATGNHPFLTGQRDNHTKKIKNIQWKAVNELNKNDLICTPINQNEYIPNLDFVDASDENFWWCIGRYFGDGWRTKTIRKSGIKKGKKNKDVIICCNKKNNETNDIIKNLTWCEYRVAEEKTTNKIYLKCKGLYDWLEQFGDKAENKHLNDVILNLPINLLKKFLDGYISADGNLDNRNNYSFTTISKNLAFGICSCVNKVYKMPCSLLKVRENRTEYIEGREVHCREQYRGCFHLTPRKQDNAFYYNNYIWCPVRKIEKTNEVNVVYNLEVEDSHSYTVNNYAVHNCATIAYDGDVESDIGIVLCKSEATGNKVLTAVIESGTIDAFGYLKQDYLIVDSIGLTYDIYKEIGIEPYSVNQLLEKIKDDKKVWDIYANGYTQCVNQCEQPKSTEKVMRYKPTNIAELTQFVAGIRPSFQTMYHIFESRQHFEYGIKALDQLLQDEYCSSSFILYQESLMKVLGFAGFPMSDTYTIIKAISKKKDYIIKNAKVKFIKNFAKAIIDTGETENEEKANELAEEVWQIVEDSAAYGFNSAHAYCMAIDSVTIAYLKAYYPLEFYKVVLQRFTNKGEKNKVSLIKQEMLKRGLKLKEIQFGDDNRQFNIDKENNCIIQTMASIKDMPKSAPEALYEIGNKDIKNRAQLYQALLDDSRINSKAIEILFKLNYFSKFGAPNRLITEFEIYKKYIDVKVINKTKLSDEEIEIIKGCANKETEKQLREIDNKKLISTIIKNTKIEKTTIFDLIKWQIEFLGYTTLSDISISPTIWIITDVENTSFGTQKFHLYNIHYGSLKQYKVSKKWLKTHNADIGDVITCVFQEKDKFKKNENGKFVKTGEQEIIIKCYKKEG